MKEETEYEERRYTQMEYANMRYVSGRARRSFILCSVVLTFQLIYFPLRIAYWANARLQFMFLCAVLCCNAIQF